MCITRRLDKIAFCHFNLHAVVAMDLYSASANDLDTICCFLAFQDISEFPRSTNDHVSATYRIA